MSAKNPRFDTITALSAAVAVFRANGSKITRFENNVPGNKEMVLDILLCKSNIAVTDQDVETATELRAYLEQKIMMATLTNARINDFFQQVTDLVTKPTVAQHQLGQLVWAPKLQADAQKQEVIKEDLGRYVFTSNYLGKEKDKVELVFTPIEVRYLSMYNCYRHVGHDGKGNLITFVNKNNIDKISKIKARIKDCNTNRYYNNAKTTQLNFVKVVE